MPCFHWSCSLNVGKVAIGAALLTGRRQVVQVVFLVARRQLNVLDRKEIKVLLRHKPRLVGTIDAAGQKERLVVFLAKLLADPFRNEPVAAELFVRRIECGPVGFDVLPGTAARQTDGSLLGIQRARKRIFRLFRRVVLVPGLCIDEVVQDLSRPADQ